MSSDGLKSTLEARSSDSETRNILDSIRELIRCSRLAILLGALTTTAVAQTSLVAEAAMPAKKGDLKLQSPKPKENSLLPEYPVSGKLAVIINGDDAEERHIENVNRAIKVLKGKGFNRFYIASDQKLVDFKGLKQFRGTTHGVDGLFSATEIKGILKKDALVFFYITGHGNMNSGQACVSLKDGCYPQNRMIQRLQGFKKAGARGIFVTDQCYSGSFPQAIVESGIEGVAMSPGIEGKETACQLFSKELFERLEADYDPNHDKVSEPSEWFTAAMAAYHIGTGIGEKENGRYSQSRAELTLKNQDSVLKTGKTLIIDVNATWCEPCKIYSKTLDELSGIVGAQTKIASITTDLEVHKNGELEEVYKTLGLRSEDIRGVPTTLIRKEDGGFEAVSGALSIKDLLDRLGKRGVKPVTQAYIEILKKQTGKSPEIILRFLERGIYDPGIINLGDDVDEVLYSILEKSPEAVLTLTDSFKTLPNFSEIFEKAIVTKGVDTLMWAADIGKTDTAQMLIEKGVNVNAKDEDGNTALAWAAAGGNADTARLLIEKGAVVDAKDTDGTTSLMRAALNGNADTARLLIEKGADVNAKDTKGKTSLMWVTDRRDTDMIKVLIENGAVVDAKDTDGTTSLMRAALNGNADTARLLIEKGADVNAKDTKGNTPLMLMPYDGRTKVVRLLLDKEADINVKNKEGQTPLMIAAQTGKHEIMSLLLEKGADLGARDLEGRNALIFAFISGQEKAVRLLLSKGADINARDEKGATPLMLMIKFGNYDSVRKLIEKRVDVNAKDKDDTTALMIASQAGKNEIIGLLLGKGADINARDKKGATPLMHAVTNGQTLTVVLLLSNKADVDAKDKNGDTPLMVASRIGRDNIMGPLLEKGADVNAKNVKNATPLMVASNQCKTKAVGLLINKGADVNARDENGYTPLMQTVSFGNSIKLFAFRAILKKGKDGNELEYSNAKVRILATARCQSEIMGLLLEKGADVNAKTNTGMTPLALASMTGQGEIMGLLLEKGADVNATDADGNTPLIYAVKYFKITAAQLLLEGGADVNAGNNNGYTALMWAARNGLTDIVQRLIEKGADVNAKRKDGMTPLDFAKKDEIKRLLQTKAK